MNVVLYLVSFKLLLETKMYFIDSTKIHLKCITLIFLLWIIYYTYKMYCVIELVHLICHFRHFEKSLIYQMCLTRFQLIVCYMNLILEHMVVHCLSWNNKFHFDWKKKNATITKPLCLFFYLLSSKSYNIIKSIQFLRKSKFILFLTI